MLTLNAAFPSLNGKSWCVSKNRLACEERDCGTSAKKIREKERTRWGFLLNVRVNTVHFGKEPVAPFALRSIHRVLALSFQLAVVRALH